ncbi:SDR family NAD(P)-dependent oxidoreductase [Microbacterium sp. LWH7-1.2]|uniref:SDR family NAD(P)-dependent oxidoreductase n=1 Tax=Microbacterium sp. LWH7-1.2 TaxID=3135257 RepID=UPI00313A2B8D
MGDRERQLRDRGQSPRGRGISSARTGRHAPDLIVGGSSGIGLELAKDLSAGGDKVIVTSRSIASAERTSDELGNGAQGFALDVSPSRKASRTS